MCFVCAVRKGFFNKAHSSAVQLLCKILDCSDARDAYDEAPPSDASNVLLRQAEALNEWIVQQQEKVMQLTDSLQQTVGVEGGSQLAHELHSKELDLQRARSALSARLSNLNMKSYFLTLTRIKDPTASLKYLARAVLLIMGSEPVTHEIRAPTVAGIKGHPATKTKPEWQRFCSLNAVSLIKHMGEQSHSLVLDQNRLEELRRLNRLSDKEKLRGARGTLRLIVEVLWMWVGVVCFEHELLGTDAEVQPRALELVRLKIGISKARTRLRQWMQALGLRSTRRSPLCSLLSQRLDCTRVDDLISLIQRYVGVSALSGGADSTLLEELGLIIVHAGTDLLTPDEAGGLPITYAISSHLHTLAIAIIDSSEGKFIMCSARSCGRLSGRNDSHRGAAEVATEVEIVSPVDIAAENGDEKLLRCLILAGFDASGLTGSHIH
jgi:hypothetical protein